MQTNQEKLQILAQWNCQCDDKSNLQWQHTETEVWEYVNGTLELKQYLDYELRFKPEPQYVPCETYEQALPFLGCKVKSKYYNHVGTIHFINEQYMAIGTQHMNFEKVFNEYTTFDGKPIGTEIK